MWDPAPSSSQIAVCECATTTLDRVSEEKEHFYNFYNWCCAVDDMLLVIEQFISQPTWATVKTCKGLILASKKGDVNQDLDKFLLSGRNHNS